MSTHMDWTVIERRLRTATGAVLELDRLQDQSPLKAVLALTMHIAGAMSHDPGLKALLKETGAIAALKERALELKAQQPGNLI